MITGDHKHTAQAIFSEVAKRRIPPIARFLARLAPRMKISPRRYLGIPDMAETEREKKHIENWL